MAERPIWIVTRGGISVTGGIARMVGYMMTDWQAQEHQPDLRMPALHLQDTTGRHGKAWMPCFFAVALVRVTVAGLAGRIGLLHIHMSAFGSVLRKGLMIHLGRLLGVPVVVHMHGADFDQFWRRLPPPGRRLVRATLRRAHRFVVLGDSWRGFFVDVVGLDPACVVVMPNAVPGPADWAPRPPPLRPAFLFLAVLEERKGLADLLLALAELRRQGVDGWTLEVAGAGDAERYRRQAVSLGLAKQVHFMGNQDAAGVRGLLARCDALVLPSHAEGLPMAILEAMASGLAVVATPVGDVGMAVTPELSGLLVPPRDPPALAAALRRLVADPALLRRMGEAGRARFLADFEISHLTARLARLFDSLLPGGDAPAPARAARLTHPTQAAE